MKSCDATCRPQPKRLYKRAELKLVLLNEKPNFKSEHVVDDRFYRSGLKVLANEPWAKM